MKQAANKSMTATERNTEANAKSRMAISAKVSQISYTVMATRQPGKGDNAWLEDIAKNNTGV